MSSHPSIEPYDPPAIVPHPSLLVLCDMHGGRWRVSDVRAAERPIVRRRPPDTDATHREFRSHDGVRAVLPLDGSCARQLRAKYAAQQLVDDADLLEAAMRCAIGLTSGTRAQLDKFGTPWLAVSRTRHYELTVATA